jgi:thioredoxin 1
VSEAIIILVSRLCARRDEEEAAMIEITEANFKQEVAESDVPVVIDFWAPWCGPCRSVAPVLEKLSGEYEGRVKVGKINIDEQQGLAEAYRVQSIPTILGITGGEVQEKSIGFRGEAPLRQMFETLLSK